MNEQKQSQNRFDKVVYCAKRAFDIEQGAPSLLGPEGKGHKPTVVALMEYEKGLFVTEQENIFDNF